MPERRLESWKEIAVYLNRGVRTVRRWEKEEGLPVHRQAHKKLGTVYAHESELDAWREGRRAPRTDSRQAADAEGSAPRRVMIAVLPFDSLADSGESDYIADGLTEEMISHLGRFSPETLGVIARTTVMLYRRTDRSVREIAADLKVDYVVEGTVRREGDRVRVTAHLIHAADQAHRWSNTYEQTIGSILVLQRDLASDIVAGVRLTLQPRHLAPVTAIASIQAEAYYSHLQGRSLLKQLYPRSRFAAASNSFIGPSGGSDLRARIRIPRRSIPAAFGLDGGGPLEHISARAGGGRACASAQSRLARCPRLARSHRCVVSLELGAGRPGGPNDSRAESKLLARPPVIASNSSPKWDRFDEALSIIDAGLVYDPLSRAIQATRAFVLLMARRFDEAIDELKLSSTPTLRTQWR